MRTVYAVAAVLLLGAVLLFPSATVQAGQDPMPMAQERQGVIRGWAFDDLDKDGIREPGEFGLAGTVICLVGYNWCDHTEWGEFEFDLLTPGTYQVELTDWPDGYFLISANPVTVQLPEGEFVQRVDFALSNDPGGVIRGKAFVDQDRDGQRDALEPGLDGVQVCLVGYNWCNYTEYGDYEFDLLSPGDYTVQVQEFPKSYHRTSPLTIHVTLGVNEIRSDVDFGFRRDHRRIK